MVVPALRKDCIAAESHTEANTWCKFCLVYDDVTVCIPIFNICRTEEMFIGIESGCEKGQLSW